LHLQHAHDRRDAPHLDDGHLQQQQQSDSISTNQNMKLKKTKW
jgi:hypothetical protein